MLTATHVRVPEDGQIEIAAFAVNISQGGWSESDQLLWFSATAINETLSLMDSLTIEILCDGQKMSRCQGSTASLNVTSAGKYHGLVIINLTLHDNGGTLGGGMNSTTQTIELEVYPVNDVPTFSIASDKVVVLQGSGCTTRKTYYGEWISPGQADCDASSKRVHNRYRFARDISLGLFEDSESCYFCESQKGVFMLTPLDPESAHRIFSQLPNISYPDGALHFVLQPNGKGNTGFNITLMDDGGLEGVTQNSSVLQVFIQVLPVNQAPGFILSNDLIEVYEDSGQNALQNFATKISADNSDLGTEPSQTYTFELEFSSIELFATGSGPTIFENGTINFVVAPNQFGFSFVTLRLRDDGGKDFGGTDTSIDRTFTLHVLPVNDAPSFTVSDIFKVTESSGTHTLTQAAINIISGPVNERCTVPTSICDAQTVTFTIEDISNPSLFLGLPILHQDGTLVFSVVDTRAGSSFLTVRLRDDGGLSSDDWSSGLNISSRECMATHCNRTCESSCVALHGHAHESHARCLSNCSIRESGATGSDTSMLSTFEIVVEPVNTLPNFELPWNVTCDLHSYFGSGLCTCMGQDPMGASDTCIHKDLTSDSIAIIKVLESSGKQNIQEFASEVTPAQGFLNRAFSTFLLDHTSDKIEFSNVLSDHINSYALLEYGTHEIKSPDGNNLYVTEQDNDVISVYQSNDDMSQGAQIPPTDRVFDHMQRFRFTPSQTIDLDYVTGLDSFNISTNSFAVAATGAQLLWENEDHMANDTCSIHLTVDCDADCCMDLLADTMGLWDLSTAYLFGSHRSNTFSLPYQVECDQSHCTVNRPKNSQCGESNGIDISPASFRDGVDRLGSAFILGSPCNTGSLVDWGNPSIAERLSASTFIINDGNVEAMQFDGLLNRGLYVTNDIDSLLASHATAKLPSSQMSLAIWFASSASSMGVYGLMAAAQDSVGCRKGFMLTYALDQSLDITFSFQVALEESDNGIPSVLALGPLPLSRSIWRHVVASYDGAFLYLYLDGVLAASKRACSKQQCGKISYPSECVRASETPFTIGTFENTRLALNFMHVGAIKTARVVRRAISPQEVEYLYAIHSAMLSASPLTETEYWVKDLGILDRLRSPDSNFASARVNTNIILKGKFSSLKQYACKFQDSANTTFSPTTSAQCSDPEDFQLCAAEYVDNLHCTTPRWFGAFKAMTIGVVIHVGGIQKPLWSKTCLSPDCGFVPAHKRDAIVGTLPWTYQTGVCSMTGNKCAASRNCLPGESCELLIRQRPGLEGTFTRFRFTTESNLYTLDVNTKNLYSISKFGAVSDCTGRGCHFQENVCVKMTFLTYACHENCDKITECTDLRQLYNTVDPVTEFPVLRGLEYMMQGAHSFTQFSIGSRHYLIAANFWDGESTVTFSPLFELDELGSAIRLRVTFLHNIKTHGARRWERIHVHGTDYLVLASYSSPCPVYQWNSGTNNMEDSLLVLPTSGASDVVSFTLEGITYVVISSFRDAATKSMQSSMKIFAMGTSYNSTHSLFGDGGIHAMHTQGGAGGISALLVQEISTFATVDLQQFEIDGIFYVAVASYGAPLLVFKAERSHVAFASLILVQQINPPLRFFQTIGDVDFYAMSVRFLKTSDPYLVVTTTRYNLLNDDEVLLLRWNGTHFLGPATEMTLAKDLAGGQAVPVDLPRTVTVFEDSSGVSYMMAASSSLGALFYEGERIVVGELDGPGPMMFSPDGRFLYVGCFYSRNIAVFKRNVTDAGRLTYDAMNSLNTSWTSNRVTDMNAADPGEWSAEDYGFPLRSITSMAMSPDGKHLYVVSFLDNATVVYARSEVSGALTQKQLILDGMTVNGRVVDGLAHPFAISVNSDGKTLYVSAWSDHSIATFDISDDGTLLQADRLKNGERLFWRFNDTTDDLPIATSQPEHGSSWSTGKYPMRLGGNGHSWSFSAKDSRYFVIGTSNFIIVAHSDVMDQSNTFSASNAKIYKWNTALATFEDFQEFPLDTAASCVSAFTVTRKNGLQMHYVTVGNEMNPAGARAGVNIYEWQAQTGLFTHHQSLDFAFPPSNAVVSIVRLKAFFVDDSQYLAVAVHSDGTNDKISSHIFRWKAVDSRDPSADQFELHQLIPSTSVNDIDFGYFGATPLLILANSAPDRQAAPQFRGNVKIYKFSRGQFQEVQTLPANEPFDVEAISIHGEGDFVAIANRQSQAPTTSIDQSVYDQVSELYRWDATESRFVLHQQFDSTFMSVVEDSASSAAKLEFCHPNCEPSDDGVQFPIPGLRGVTSFTSFLADGENYLAVAQSVCEPEFGRLKCKMPQPKSAILQFNRLSKKYEELQSMTSLDFDLIHGGPIPDDELKIHQYAFRMNTGRAVRFDFFAIGDLQFLLLNSLTRGAVLFEWDFEKVIGLNGPVAIESKQNKVFVLSQTDAAVVALEHSTRADDVGNSVRRCSSGCIQFVDAISEMPLNFDRKRTTKTRGIRGLRGGTRLELDTASGLAGNGDLKVRVYGKLPRNQYVCAPLEPNSPTKTKAIINNREVFAPDAHCQRLVFGVTRLSSDNPILLQSEPTFAQNGALSFTPTPYQSGQATFRVVLTDDAGLNSASHDFTIEVLPVNNRPSFVASDILVNENRTAVQKLVFAVNVSAGQAEEDQSISWDFSYTNPDVFASPPSLLVEIQNGQQVGVLQFMTNQKPGASEFTVRLVDDGSSEIDKGDENAALQQTFSVYVRGRNQAPAFSVVANVTLCQDAEEQSLSNFAQILSAGAPAEGNQETTFSLHSVSCTFECSRGPAAGKGLFSKFDLLPDGTMVMQTQEDYVGGFSVTIALKNSGGTAFGGIDTAYQSFLLMLLPSADSVPTTSKHLKLAQNSQQVSHRFVAFPNVSQSVAYTYQLFEIEDGDAVFAIAPYVDTFGDVHFAISADAVGTAYMSVKRSIAVLGSSLLSVAGCSTVLDQSALSVVISAETTASTDLTLKAPSFDIPESQLVVEGRGYQSVSNFATGITAGANRGSSTQLTFIASFTSTQDKLFTTEPRVTSDGTLEFAGATHGSASVQVQLQVAGDASESMVTRKQFTLMIFPLPRVQSITPQIVPLEGNVRITVRGHFFGSQYSRGYSAPTYGNFSIYVGRTRCVDEVYISDTEATCMVLSGVGASTVSFNISDGAVTRTGSLEKAVVHALVLYAGASQDAEQAGFVGFGPTSISSGSFSLPSASAGDAMLNISRAVLAVAKYAGKIFAGGNFRMAAGVEIGHILSWDGLKVERIERGLDGVVESMTVHQGLLVVGGQFMTALGVGGSSLRSGGLVGWNGLSWTLIGDADVQGIVTTCFTVGSNLYIAGRFRAVGTLKAEGMAVYDGSSWQTIGQDTAVSGGLVNTMATLHGDLYVGGTFSKMGNTDVAGFAKWDGRRWSALGSFNGAVNTIAVDGEFILVGGDFTQVDGVAVNNIARYYSGKWTSLGGGLDGTVFSISSFGPCVYVGGAFTNSLSADGLALHVTKYLTRWCVPAEGEEQRFEKFDTFDSLGPVHVIQPFF